MYDGIEGIGEWIKGKGGRGRLSTNTKKACTLCVCLCAEGGRGGSHARHGPGAMQKANQEIFFERLPPPLRSGLCFAFVLLLFSSIHAVHWESLDDDPQS